MKVKLTVNGEQRSDDVEPRLLLVHYLREQLGLRAANVDCDTTSCGACTVLLNGVSVKSCTVLTVQADGQDVTTAEGLARDGELHPVQQAFQQEHGLQCGFSASSPVAAITMPGVQKPHCRPCSAWNARCTGCSSPSRARPSAVITSCPAACAVSTVQDLTDWPLSSTVQAPHEVVSQPTLAARRPSTSRR